MISDERILKFLAYAMEKGIVKTEMEFADSIGFSRTNLSNVRKGRQHFGRDHIAAFCAVYGINANWVFGFETNMTRKPPLSALEQLNHAVQAVEFELLAKNKGRK